MSNTPSHGGGWANPAPAGLTALGVACFVYFAALTGQVPHTATFLIGCWLLGGCLVQFTVGLIELKEGAQLGGNVFLFFSGFFMLAGGTEFFTKLFGTEMFTNMFGSAGVTGEISGWAWIVLTATLWLWTPAYLKTSPKALSILVVVLDIAILFVTLKDLALMDAATAGMIAGWFLLADGILGIYLAAALQLNAAFGKTILPIGATPFL